MQGRERADRQLLDAGALVGHLVPAGSMFAFLAAHRQELFGDEDFADLFPSGKGRPSVPASVMASVMVLQVLRDYSGAEAAEAARCDLRWKAACGFPLDHGGFDPPELVYWRRRLAKSGRPHRISDAVRKVIGETGVLKGRRRRAVDSTILADAVATRGGVSTSWLRLCSVCRANGPLSERRRSLSTAGHQRPAGRHGLGVMSRSSPKTSTRTSDVGCRDYVQMAGLEHAGNRLPALGIRQGHSLGRQREQGVLGLVRLVRDEDTDTPDLSAVAGPCPAR